MADGNQLPPAIDAFMEDFKALLVKHNAHTDFDPDFLCFDVGGQRVTVHESHRIGAPPSESVWSVELCPDRRGPR